MEGLPMLLAPALTVAHAVTSGPPSAPW